MQNDAKFWVEIIATLTVPICFVGVILYRLKRPAGMSYRVIQLLMIGAGLPTILILALEKLIETGTIGALLGAMVGYVFSPAAAKTKQDA